MNTVQRNYLEAKAAKEAADKAEAEFEKSLLKKYGRTETDIADIEDEEVFNQICKEIEEADIECRFYGDYSYLKSAEDELIKWALATVPQVKFDDKSKNLIFRHWKYRAQIISLALQIKA